MQKRPPKIDDRHALSFSVQSGAKVITDSPAVLRMAGIAALMCADRVEIVQQLRIVRPYVFSKRMINLTS